MARQAALDSANRAQSQQVFQRGPLAALDTYLYTEQGFPANFVISGGMYPEERLQALEQYLGSLLGKGPVIILHNNDTALLREVERIWRNRAPGSQFPVWAVSPGNPIYEPFCGLNPMQTVSVMRQLALKLNYTPSPVFDKVVRAHIEVLQLLKVPVSLSGFRYLCGYADLGVFHDNILSLPCDRMRAERIWSDMSAGRDDRDGAFDMFRSVISAFAEEAACNGWSDDGKIGEASCAAAAQTNHVLLLDISSAYKELFMTYLAEELKTTQRQFVLLLDGIQIRDERFLDYLTQPGRNYYLGVITDNLANAIVCEETTFRRFVEKIDTFVVFKHGTGAAAEVLSEIIGKYDWIRQEETAGNGHGLFQFLPHYMNQGTQTTTENRYRIMPEEINRLRSGQAIVFDTRADLIIRYN